MKTVRVFAVAAAVVVSAAAPAAARPKAPPSAEAALAEVTVTGCVARGSGAFCSKLTAEDGKTYSFAGQPVSEGKCYVVTGKQTMGSCRDGTQLGVTKLIPAPVDCCPKP